MKQSSVEVYVLACVLNPFNNQALEITDGNELGGDNSDRQKLRCEPVKAASCRTLHGINLDKGNMRERAKYSVKGSGATGGRQTDRLTDG